MAKKSDGRGKKKGSGPKKGAKYDKGSQSENRKLSIQAAIDKLADETGMTLDEAMVRMCYDNKVQGSVRASVYKSVLEATVAKETKQDTTIRADGPQMYLPELQPDPALEVIQGGKGE